MNQTPPAVDVLCVGHASYDLVFSVPKHPEPDEKLFADELISCGGGPAANAAVTVARLGYSSAFAGYLGLDLFGDRHCHELEENGVDIRMVVRGPSPTPISAVLVKPDGKRALINYKRDTRPLPANTLDFSKIDPKVVLFDGHEPDLSIAYIQELGRLKIPTVLDAGSLHFGTEQLMSRVDFLVCSEKFALQVSGSTDRALKELSKIAATVVITMSERGLIWHYHESQGSLTAYDVDNVDSTGAGDAFHGAFAAAIASGLSWPETLRYASAAGAFCCTKMGARPGLPYNTDLIELLGSTIDRSNSQLL